MIEMEIVTPDGDFYKEEVKMIIVRGVMGDLAFMKNTAPTVTPLAIGTMTVKYDDDTYRRGITHGGYVSNLNNKVTIVADSFEWEEEIDVERSLASKERAEQRLQSPSSEVDIERAKLSLARAIARLNLKDKI